MWLRDILQLRQHLFASMDSISENIAEINSRTRVVLRRTSQSRPSTRQVRSLHVIGNATAREVEINEGTLRNPLIATSAESIDGRSEIESQYVYDYMRIALMMVICLGISFVLANASGQVFTFSHNHTASLWTQHSYSHVNNLGTKPLDQFAPDLYSVEPFDKCVSEWIAELAKAILHIVHIPVSLFLDFEWGKSIAEGIGLPFKSPEDIIEKLNDEDSGSDLMEYLLRGGYNVVEAE